MKRAAVTYQFENKIAPYADALRATGVEPVLVTPERPVLSLNAVDGLLLTGGTDLNPALYGAERDPRTEDPDDDRDALEIRLLREALERDVPVLAICRGMQLFNVVHPGGSLAQHIDGHSVRGPDLSVPVHTVVAEPGTALGAIIGSGEVPVNSRHHQAVEKVGEGLVLVARAADGTIEAVERPDRRFAVAVQWHPEDQILRFAEQRRLFDAFRDCL